MYYNYYYCYYYTATTTTATILAFVLTTVFQGQPWATHISYRTFTITAHSTERTIQRAKCALESRGVTSPLQSFPFAIANTRTETKRSFHLCWLYKNMAALMTSVHVQLKTWCRHAYARTYPTPQHRFIED